MLARIIYETIVMYSKPGGHHHVDILHRGNTVEILEGLKYSERAWKDKRFVKVKHINKVGYVIADCLKLQEVQNAEDNNG